jgi:glucose-1-phosphate cytidylyltransferase
MMTYGDGVSDVDIKALVSQHQKSGKLATVTAVQPLGRFGAMSLAQDGRVERFQEKAQGDGSWINAGYFVLEPGVIDYIKDDKILFEKEPVERLAQSGQLMAYKHNGFWHPMDTMRDKNYLEELWRSGKVPWKVWG